MEEQTLKRRDLSGIYIFDTFPGEEKRRPTCLEDCQPETRKEWLEQLEKPALIGCIETLCETLRTISDQFGIIAAPLLPEGEE